MVDKLLEKINELKGLKLGGYGFKTNDLFRDVSEHIKNIVDVQLEGEDMYGRYREILVRGDGKILVVIGTDEYFTLTVFEDVAV